MPVNQRVILKLIGVFAVLIPLFLLTAFSRRNAVAKASSLLRPDDRIAKVSLSLSLPIHWHVVIETLWRDDPFHEKEEVADTQLLCISIMGEHLRAYPAGFTGDRLALMMEEARMRCAYGRGKDWIVEKDPLPQKSNP